MENQVLTSNSREGDFVHQNQTMAKDDGFRNVSKLWYNQTISYDEGIEALERDKASRQDVTENIGDVVIKVGSEGLVVMVDGIEYTPTLHAMEQLATWCDTPHTMIHHYMKPKLKQNGDVKYNRNADDLDLMVRALRLGQSRIDADKPMLFRTYNDGTLRAVLSDRYAIIDNRWYLETLKLALPGGRLSHWRGNADTIYGNVLINDSIRAESDSEYGGMLSLSNCEIGLRRLLQIPSIFRAICMNGCIWGQKKGNKYRQVHRGKIDLESLRKQIFDNINEQIPLIDSVVDTFLETRSWTVTDRVARIVAVIAEDNRFSPAQAMSIMEHYGQFEQDSKSAFGVINAITRAGQKFDNDVWVSFDEVAGQIVQAGRDNWENLNKRAGFITDEKMKKLYTVAA